MKALMQQKSDIISNPQGKHQENKETAKHTIIPKRSFFLLSSLSLLAFFLLSSCSPPPFLVSSSPLLGLFMLSSCSLLALFLHSSCSLPMLGPCRPLHPRLPFGLPRLYRVIKKYTLQYFSVLSSFRPLRPRLPVGLPRLYRAIKRYTLQYFSVLASFRPLWHIVLIAPCFDVINIT